MRAGPEYSFTSELLTCLAKSQVRIIGSINIHIIYNKHNE